LFLYNWRQSKKGLGLAINY